MRHGLLATALLGLLFLGAPEAARAQAATDRQPATLVVLVPSSTATLTVEGTRTRQTGPRRTFVSPPLEPGKSYTYTLAVVWQPNNYETWTRTRKVAVSAGKETEVDLRKADKGNPDDLVIRYVPTPPEVVDAMLKLADVGPGDVVFDLGCGDGRIVVAAVSRFKAKRGVGVDLDPERIRESKDNAREHGVQDKVEFRQENVLKLKDLSEASVVALYMSDDLNLLLRPILQKTLKPGARIVSHRFRMGDWKPLKTETVTGRDGAPYEIHLWKIDQGGSKEK
jgi:uncharacterized protein (TIGR03000 family)